VVDRHHLARGTRSFFILPGAPPNDSFSDAHTTDLPAIRPTQRRQGGFRDGLEPRRPDHNLG
jgi:hypothetical protein